MLSTAKKISILIIKKKKFLKVNYVYACIVLVHVIFFP